MLGSTVNQMNRGLPSYVGSFAIGCIMNWANLIVAVIRPLSPFKHIIFIVLELDLRASNQKRCPNAQFHTSSYLQLSEDRNRQNKHRNIGDNIRNASIDEMGLYVIAFRSRRSLMPRSCRSCTLKSNSDNVHNSSYRQDADEKPAEESGWSIHEDA